MVASRAWHSEKMDGKKIPNKSHPTHPTPAVPPQAAPGGELQGTAGSGRVDHLEERLTKAGAGCPGPGTWWKTLGKTLGKMVSSPTNNWDFMGAES